MAEDNPDTLLVSVSFQWLTWGTDEYDENAEWEETGLQFMTCSLVLMSV